jgi:D-amino-acid dehydrogenase
MRRPDSPVYIKPRLDGALASWLFRFWRHCNDAAYNAGLHATARLAEPTMELYDKLAADGVTFRMWSDGLLFVFRDAELAQEVLAGLQPMSEHGYRLPDRVVTGESLRDLEPALSDGVAAGFVVAEERHVDPVSLCAGLAQRLDSLGVKILEGTSVIGFVGTGPFLRAVRTTTAEIATDHVVVCSGAWTTDLVRQLGLRIPMQAGKGYSFSIKPRVMPRRPLYLAESKVGATPLADRLRLAGTMELSGVNLRIDARRVQAIAHGAQRYLPGWGGVEMKDIWTGMRPVAADGLPIVGPVPGWENLALATGHSMLGITLGPATGEAVAEAVVTGRVPEVLSPFSPGRF